MTGDNRLQFLGLFGSQMEAIRSSTSMIATSARGYLPYITLQCISSHIQLRWSEVRLQLSIQL